MITAKEALEATNPALDEADRIKRAENIMAAVAANDAYINSRTDLEAAILTAKGQQVAPPFEQVENGASRGAAVESVTDAAKAASIESTVVEDTSKGIEDAKVIEKVAAEAFPGEIKVLEDRLKQLTGGVL